MNTVTEALAKAFETVSARPSFKLVADKIDRSDIQAKRASTVPSDWIGIYEDLETGQWYVTRRVPE